MIDPIFQGIINKIKKVIDFFKQNKTEDVLLSRDWEFIFSEIDGWVVIYCSSSDEYGGYWLYPMLYPESKIENLKKSLPSYSINPSSGGYDHVMSGDDHWIEPYWKDNEDLNSSEVPVFFQRHHYGRPKGEENYIEFNQLITHSLGLHFSEQKQALCTVDESGEEIEKIKIIKEQGSQFVAIRRKTLDKLLHLGKWMLVRYVDFTRHEKDFFNIDGCEINTVEPTEYEAKYEIRYVKLKYVEFRGAQIVRPITSKEKVLSFWTDEEDDEKKYASFIVHDWKNKRILEDYSLAPENFANYFTKSDLPFEISPIFFKAEVLDKYKHNPDKYEMSERSIYCRGGWHLKTYDINEYGQVHTYAIYLNRLPYSEQLHWLQYNVKPKGGISKRAFKTDMEGEFPDSRSELEELKVSLHKLESLKIIGVEGVIWSPKGGSWENASKGIHLVHTENPNQWHDFVIALANTVNEGLQKKTLSQIASFFGNDNNELGTLGLIKFILKANSREDLIDETHFVLNELQQKRNQGKAHGAWKTPEGSLIADAKDRLVKTTTAIKKLSDFLETIKIN
ncbi:MAG: hypothetical protein HQK72_17020 [Desulfamplus sp.]|nr:hypothetical protein [Desulfamplus sp.]